MIGGSTSSEGPIDLESVIVADHGNQLVTLQLRTILTAQTKPDDIYYELQQGVQCQMHSFNALAGSPLLQDAKVSAYIEQVRQQHSSLAAGAGPRGFSTDALNAYLGTFASSEIFMGGPSLQYINRGTPKHEILNQLSQGCNRFTVLVRKGTELFQYSQAICIRYSHQSHKWLLIDSENTGPALLNDDEWLQICGGIRLPYLGQSGAIFERSSFQSSDANRHGPWLDWQLRSCLQPLEIGDFEPTNRPSRTLSESFNSRCERVSQAPSPKSLFSKEGMHTGNMNRVVKTAVMSSKLKEVFQVKRRNPSTTHIQETRGTNAATRIPGLDIMTYHAIHAQRE